jgi:hypothetical protein
VMWGYELWKYLLWLTDYCLKSKQQLHTRPVHHI